MSGALNIYRASAQDIKMKMLLYGSPGAGKTTLALTANDHPELSPALVLNFEGGLLSVTNRGDVDVLDIRSSDDLERVFWYFAENNPEITKYKTIIVDSGSELYNRTLREVVAQNLARRKRKGDEDDYELEDYGKSGNIVFRLFSSFRDLPRHVIVTAHPKFIYPSGGDALNSEPKEVRPSFSTSLAQRLEGIFDFVHYLYAYDLPEPTGVTGDDGQAIMKAVTHRALLTRSMGAYHAKTRGPNFASALGDTVIDPTIPVLYDLLLQTESNGQLDATVDIAGSYVDELHRNGQDLQPIDEDSPLVVEELEEVTA